MKTQKREGAAPYLHLLLVLWVVSFIATTFATQNRKSPHRLMAINVKRLYKDAKAFLKLRSTRNRAVKKHAEEAAVARNP
jgi:hypothetical protein